MKRSLVLLAFLAFCSLACSKVPTSDIRTQVAMNPKIQFSAMKSYDWSEGLGVLVDETATWQGPGFNAAEEVRFLVDENLRARGMVQSDTPDLYVTFLIVANVQQLHTVKDAQGQALDRLEGVGEGALVIELIDARTGQTVWLGGAEAELRTGYTDDQRRKRLSYAVSELLAQLPR